MPCSSVTVGAHPGSGATLDTGSMIWNGSYGRTPNRAGVGTPRRRAASSTISRSRLSTWLERLIQYVLRLTSWQLSLRRQRNVYAHEVLSHGRWNFHIAGLLRARP